MVKKGIKERGKKAIQIIDLFSSGVAFRVNREENLTTWFGSALSFFLIVIVGYYGVLRFEALIDYKDTKFQSM